jgi:hypothetical protein
MRFSTLMRIVCTSFVVCVVMGVPSALASVPAPGWRIESVAGPTRFSVEDSADAYQIDVENAGAQTTDGSPVTIVDELPAGVTVGEVELYSSNIAGGGTNLASYCSVGATVRCELPDESELSTVQPDGRIQLVVHVTVPMGVGGPLVNSARVSGGGAPELAATSSNTVGSTAPFGPSGFDFFIDDANGTRDTQAGDHPYELTTEIDLNSGISRNYGLNDAVASPQDVKDVVVDTPVGFAGSILAAPECTFRDLSSNKGCPPDTAIGHIRTEPQFSINRNEGLETYVNSPIWNLVPERGVPAEFGYVDGTKASHIFYVRVVPTPAGYVLQTINPDIPQVALSRIVVTLYGNPAARDASTGPQIPFFTNPMNCSGEEPTAKIYMDSWENPARFNADGTPANLEEGTWARVESKSPPMTGCNTLRFTPEIEAQPTTHEADTPSGLDFEIKVPQTETIGVPATPTMKKAVVRLPEGFTVDPSAADGLQACSEAQIGWLGGTHLNFNASQPQCPEASKIGSLTLETPLVPNQLEGEMFLARQDENPFGTTLAAYVVVNDPITGVLIKIPGEFLPDPVTGRLTAVFDENPSLPFSDLKLHFFGGPRAELATPEQCGTFTVDTELSPWSFPDSGSAASPFDTFPIDEACPGGFAPSFTAGSMNLQSGAYTSFVASFQRSDKDQELAGLTVTLPPGLLANLNGVPLCTGTDANAGTCPESTQVGTVLAGAGPGPNPLFVSGKAYLTGPYNGGPYGLSIVVPAVAGPYNFGTVIVRQSIRIDPLTAQVIDVSDPFPTIIDGIPLRLRRVDVRLERPGFTFNPTNCSKLGFSGSVSGTPLGSPTRLEGSIGYATQPGSTSGFTTPFQVTNCTTLAFKPVFKVSTQGKTSRANGASLSVKLSYPKAAFGSQANIKSVKVDLPKQLPSRLSTLQKACPDSVFNQNPGACPAASRVGIASATTPILQTTLTGPAYFVSHGGAKFPELTIVLQGQGIVVDLHGETFISRTGITSSTFRQVPDVPIGVFTLNLPEGANSALAAPSNLCKATLKMPTAFTAQNGATTKQSTPISVTGCARKKTKRVHKGTAHRKR